LAYHGLKNKNWNLEENWKTVYLILVIVNAFVGGNDKEWSGQFFPSFAEFGIWDCLKDFILSFINSVWDYQKQLANLF